MKSYSEYSDSELAALLGKGDDMAFAEIYDRHWEKLFAVAFHRCDDELDAEEIVQDVFYSLWKRRSELDLQYGLSTYLSVAVKYQVINALGKKHRKYLHLKSISSEEQVEETTELWLNEKELKRQIEEGIKILPEKCRIVFLMSRNEGKSARQIAEELGISQKTVEAHMGKALKTLRNSLNLSVPILLFILRK